MAGWRDDGTAGWRDGGWRDGGTTGRQDGDVEGASGIGQRKHWIPVCVDSVANGGERESRKTNVGAHTRETACWL